MLEAVNFLGNCSLDKIWKLFQYNVTRFTSPYNPFCPKTTCSEFYCIHQPHTHFARLVRCCGLQLSLCFGQDFGEPRHTITYESGKHKERKISLL